MDNRAFLVLGAESTGTRLVTQILIAAGCRGSAKGIQPFDRGLPEPNGTPIVWRRSFPHAKRWPDTHQLVMALAHKGYYNVHFVVTSRDWQATALSQVKAGHVENQAIAWNNLAVAYRDIFSAIAYKSYTMLSYESLVQRPKAVTGWLCGRMGLALPVGLEIRDENDKWLSPLNS